MKIRINYRNVILIALIALLIILFYFVNHVFLSFQNIINFIQQTSVLAIVSLGMAFILIAKGLDLSVGSNIAFSGAIGVTVLNLTGNPYLGILASILGGTFIGLLNGTFIGKLKFNPLMMTLATMVLARGLNILLTKGSLFINNKTYLWLGQGFIGPIPIIFFIAVPLYIIADFILRRTVFGKQVYAVGSNIRTSKASGIGINNIITSTYIITGFLVGFSSIITMGRLGSVQPWAGLGLEFDVITALVIGGVSLAGGVGTIGGVLLGIIVIGILANGLSFVNITNFYLYIIRGSVLIFVILLDRIFLKDKK